MHLTITVAVGIETDRRWSNHWHHCNGCEWEQLNHFDERISELCFPCKPINAITSLATTDKQNSNIFIQANVVLISTIRNNCSSYRTWRVWHVQLLSASYLRIWCHMPRLFVNKNAWEQVNSLERWRGLGSCAVSTEPSHTTTGMSPQNLLLLQTSSDRLGRLLSQVCCGRGERWYKLLKSHMHIWVKYHPMNSLYMNES